MNSVTQKRLLLSALALAALAALFFRLYQLDSVPPGVHHDEVINAEIAGWGAENGWRIFYSQGWGREGLYYPLLGASLNLPLPTLWRLRLPSILAGLIGLFFTYGWVNRAFGSRVAFVTVAGMAVSFWVVALSRSALRATLVLPISAAALWFLVSIMKGPEEKTTESSSLTNKVCRVLVGRFGKSSRDLPNRATVYAPKDDRRTTRIANNHRSWWRSGLLPIMLLALLLGALLYTYRAARIIPVILLLLILYQLLIHRHIPRRLLVILVGTVLVALPLALFLIQNPEAEPRLEQVNQPLQELIGGNVKPALRGTLATIGMFGWQGDPENHYNLANRPVFEPIGAILFYIGLIIAFGRFRQPIYALILIWFFAGLLPGWLSEPAPHFIHTIVAQPVAYVFPGLAVDKLANWLARRPNLATLGPVALAAWLILTAVWTFHDYFRRWPEQSQVQAFFQTELASIARYLDRSPSTTPVVVCTAFLNETDPFWRSGRQSIPYMLNRDDLNLRWYDCASAHIWPQAGAESRYLFTGDTGVADWVIGDWQSQARPIETTTRSPVTGIAVNAQKDVNDQLATLTPPLAYSLPVNMEDMVDFLGYELTNPTVNPGETVELITCWQVKKALPVDVAIFVHLMNESNELVAQGDALSLLSDTLLPGDIFAQQHLISLPTDLPSGNYQLSTGIYSRVGDFPPLQIVTFDPASDSAERIKLAEITIR